jgi:hypothetical protein
MKKSFLRVFFISALFSTFLISCKKDKDPALEGKWEMTTTGVYYFNSGAKVEGVDAPTLPSNFVIDLRGDGSGTATMGGETENFTWKSEGNNQKISLMESTFHVKKLSDNELFILLDPNDMGDEEEDITDQTMTIGLTFKRL